MRCLLQNDAPTETWNMHTSPPLLHLAVIVNGNCDQFLECASDRQREGCVLMLLQLLPELCDQLEIPDHAGGVNVS